MIADHMIRTESLINKFKNKTSYYFELHKNKAEPNNKFIFLKSWGNKQNKQTDDMQMYFSK